MKEAILALLGVIVGAWTTHCFAIRLANSNARHFAGVRLREAFAPELAKFSEPGRINMIKAADVLERAFEKHQIAINEFRFYLGGTERDDFDNAWRRYYRDQFDQVDFSQYGIEEEARQLAFARMEAIVAFTNPKSHITSLLERTLRRAAH